MTARDPNVAKVELIAVALGPLREQFVFVGGCAVGLLITDTAAAPVRATFDVDLVASVSALSAYHELEKGMPTDPKILGFSNRWYSLAVASAGKLTLPSGIDIRLIAAPVFIATKFEAHADRGAGDLLASHDLEDIVNVIDGRELLLEEIAASPQDLREYLKARCRELLATQNFLDYLPGLIAPGDEQADRAELIAERLKAIAEIP